MLASVNFFCLKKVSPLAINASRLASGLAQAVRVKASARSAGIIRVSTQRLRHNGEQISVLTPEPADLAASPFMATVSCCGRKALSLRSLPGRGLFSLTAGLGKRPAAGN